MRLRRTRSWWIRLGLRLESRLGILLFPPLDFFHSMLLSSQTLNLWTNNTSVERTPLPSMGCILGPQVLHFPGSLVLVLVSPIALGGVTGLGVLGLLAVLTALAPFGVLGFLARTLAVVTPLTTSVSTSGLEVTTVVLCVCVCGSTQPVSRHEDCIMLFIYFFFGLGKEFSN